MPGGWIVIDHYTYGLSYFTKTFPLFRFFFRRMDPVKSMKCTEGLVNSLWPLHRAVRNFPLGRLLLTRVSPVLDYHRAYPQMNEGQQKEWALLDTHDLLTDWYKHLRTRRQVLHAMQRLGLVNVWCEYGGNGVEARGQRPLA